MTTPLVLCPMTNKAFYPRIGLVRKWGSSKYWVDTLHPNVYPHIHGKVSGLSIGEILHNKSQNLDIFVDQNKDDMVVFGLSYLCHQTTKVAILVISWALLEGDIPFSFDTLHGWKNISIAQLIIPASIISALVNASNRNNNTRNPFVQQCYNL